MTLSTKINVLSSHCENMMFRVKLKAVDTRTNEDVPGLVAFSEPIKVISKPDQLPGKAKQGKATTAAPKSKKRTINDVITENLEKIQEQQKEHHDLLVKIYGDLEKQRNTALPLASFDDFSSTIREHCGSLSASGGSLSLSKSSSESKPSEEENALEKAFHNFLDVYNKVNPEQRPEKIRRIVRNSSARKTETFCEIVGLFNDEGLQKELGRDCSLTFSPSSMEVGTGCNPETCPHKKELERIDEFYRDFLAAPSALGGGEDPLLPMLFSNN